MKTWTLPNNRQVRCINKYEAEYLHKELWEQGGYLQHGLTVQKGATVIDAGANIGLFALWIFEQCEGDVQVYSFEPVPAVFEALAANFADWAPEHLHAFALGLSDTEEQVEILYHPRMTLWSSSDASMDKARNNSLQDISGDLANRADPSCATRLVPKSILAWVLRQMFKSAGRSSKVPCTFRPLGPVLREHGIAHVDLLKIDTEGNELKILNGIEQEQWSFIQQVAMEIDVVEEGGLSQVVSFLEERGFSVVTKAQPIGDTDFEEVGAKHQPWGLWARRSSV